MKKMASFIFYRGMYEVFKTLAGDEKIELLHMVCEFGLNGVTVDPKNEINAQLFMLIKPKIEANKRKTIDAISNKTLRSDRMKAANSKGRHSRSEWEEMLSFFGVCVRCKGTSGLANIEKDHIVPIYLGGSNSIKNIQPFCARCNSSKGPDCTDYRVPYCTGEGIDFPEKWAHDGVIGGENVTI